MSNPLELQLQMVVRTIMEVLMLNLGLVKMSNFFNPQNNFIFINICRGKERYKMYNLYTIYRTTRCLELILWFILFKFSSSTAVSYLSDYSQRYIEILKEIAAITQKCSQFCKMPGTDSLATADVFDKKPCFLRVQQDE